MHFCYCFAFEKKLAANFFSVLQLYTHYFYCLCRTRRKIQRAIGMTSDVEKALQIVVVRFSQPV